MINPAIITYNNQINKFIYFHKNIYIMKKEIKNQERFQIIDGSAAITVPAGTYQLYISADGENFTTKGDPINGPETIVLANAPQGLYCYIDGIAEGTITTKTALFKRESEMNVIFDVPNKRYSVYGQDEEATGTISKPKILTLDRYSKNYDTGVNAFAKENSGAAIALVTDAEFLTDADFDQMFRTRKDGERVKQALNFDEIVSTKEGRKNTNVYYLTMNGTQIPFMNVPVRNEVSLGELYNLSRIGLYACGSLEEKYLNQTQKDLITSEGVGISVENAMRYMKRYIGQFDVGKATNAAGDRTAMLSKIFRRLSSSYKLLGRADSFNFAGMLYAAVNQIKKDSDAETTALISYAKTKFNSSLLKYLA